MSNDAEAMGNVLAFYDATNETEAALILLRLRYPPDAIARCLTDAIRHARTLLTPIVSTYKSAHNGS